LKKSFEGVFPSISKEIFIEISSLKRNNPVVKQHWTEVKESPRKVSTQKIQIAEMSPLSSRYRMFVKLLLD
jgi:hypothetical protein